MQCYNMGLGEGGDVEWRCEADIPGDLRLGRTDVTCEGYDYPDDPYVLRGSCGVEYRLQVLPGGRVGGGRRQAPKLAGADDDDDPGYWPLVIVAALALALFWVTRNGTPVPARPRRGWGGWGGGDDQPPGPPPPYSPTDRKPFSPEQAAMREQWRPGFWTGLGAGAAAASLLGRRGQQPPQERVAPQPSRWERDSDDAGPSMRTASGFATTRRR
ncbi:uncharacterized protein V1510DRAFT_418379 [Dipodascopsis tothii]|uniref:uncharacterized protein n=1 Tax=Dipodascopsis tothii TaxID=44089 RepID=UPI0034CD220B